MNKFSTDIDDRVDMYLLNKLSESERSEFEQLMLEDNSVFALVRERELLVDSLNSAKNEIHSAPIEMAKRETFGFNNTLSFWEWCRLGYSSIAMACIALLGVGIVNLVLQNPNNCSGVEIASQLPNHYVERTRGDDNRQILNGPFPMTVHFDTTNLEGESVFSVSVLDESNDSVLFAAPSIPADEDGWISLDFNEPLAGNFTIKITPESQSSETILPPYLILFRNNN